MFFQYKRARAAAIVSNVTVADQCSGRLGSAISTVTPDTNTGIGQTQKLLILQLSQWSNASVQHWVSTLHGTQAETWPDGPDMPLGAILLEACHGYPAAQHYYGRSSQQVLLRAVDHHKATTDFRSG